MDSTAAAPSPRPTVDEARLALTRIGVASPSALPDALREVAHVAAHALAVDRVAVWRFFDAGRLLRCDVAVEPACAAVYEGTVLRADDFRTALTALTARRVAAVADVAGDPVTEPFRAPYLTPLGITALLAAPIARDADGEVIGVVCHEHRGAPRPWTGQDCDCAAAVAGTLARVYEAGRRLDADGLADRDRDRLQRLSELGAVGRLAAGLAHDMGNLLHAVAGNAHLLYDLVPPGSEAADLVRSLLRATEQGAAVTRQVAHLGRTDARSPQLTDLRARVTAALDQFRLLAGARIEVTTEMPAPVSGVFVDHVEIERVLLNLAANARDAMPAGGTLTVAVHDAMRPAARGPGRAVVALEVRDRGAGMDDATRRHAAEPYFTTRPGRGRGLGLAVVEQVVAASGGDVEIDSRPGDGTTVRVFLPAIAPPAVAAVSR